ncbi:MAG: DUF1003 domain-containing protein [Candidatus Levyibacteriota bacterium]
MTKRKITISKHKDFQLQNIEDLIALEKRDRIGMNVSDRIASHITSFSGSMLYVFLHVGWFGIWIIWNMGFFNLKPFDPFPFSLLTMMVSLEAIFLSAFVLISQNQQALQADKRAKVDMEINMIAERENTVLIEMIAQIHQHLKIQGKDKAEIIQLKKRTKVNKLAQQIDKAELRAEKGKRMSPQSAADTSK